jgi:hypothetical protein
MQNTNKSVKKRRASMKAELYTAKDEEFESKDDD